MDCIGELIPDDWVEVLRMMTLLSVKSIRAPAKEIQNKNAVLKLGKCLGGWSRVFPTRQPACGGA